MKNQDIVKIENLKIKPNTYIIRWNVTKICNYYCDFCIQGDKNKHLQDYQGETETLRLEICDKIIDFIENKVSKQYKNIKLFLIGGEVTVLKEFIKILQKIVDSKFKGNIEIHIKTNLSCNKQVLKNMVKLFSSKNRYIVISASYYKEFTTEKEFIKKIKYLHYTNAFGKHLKRMRLPKIFTSYNVKVGVCYPLFTEDDYALFLNFKEKYSKYANFIKYIVIRNYKTVISEEFKEKLCLINNENKNIIVTLKDGSTQYFSGTPRISLAVKKTRHFNPYGMLCDSGVHNLSIGNLGDISRCPSCKEKTRVGNILKNEIDLLTDKFLCPSHSCNCNYYRIIEKEN